ncbi:RabGAP/TBC [Lentinus brumalis]|uniref:RabGAP/TBC n=1 Tax=Lentinus brumalis TaxID=2498619 RepID=A0A371D3G5_9APHY|nr:RabGAP/TBC [Polyporus brumalis]
MSDGEQVGDASKALTPITTTSTTGSADKEHSPTSPELPTAVATKPPTRFSAFSKDSDERSPALTSIAESRTEDETVTAEGADAPSHNSPAEERAVSVEKEEDTEDDAEAFTTPEVKAESLPSPELADIPLSPADLPSVPPSADSPTTARDTLTFTDVTLSSTDGQKAISETSTTSRQSDQPVTTPPVASSHSADPLQSASDSADSLDTAREASTVAGSEDKSRASPTSPKPHSTVTTPRPLTMTTNAPVAAGLDSLLSPTETEAKFSIRESVAASDTTEDETRFSTVLLSSARQSLAVSPSAAPGHSSHLHTVDEGTGSEESTLVDDWKKHKKTASNSTILSGNNVPFLKDEVRPRPSSLQGAQQIKEEFYQRLDEEAESAVDWDFWGQVMNDYQGFASEHPEQLAKAIERGIPKSLRGMVWQLMSASKDPELENTYLRLLKETSPHEKAILRDLGRTFPHHAFFTDGHGIGQENLFNVLKAYSLYDPQVGYCQGLPFIVAILLLNMPDEEAFCLFVRLMHSYDIRGHFLPEMPKLQLRLFERLLEEVLPVLHLHFVRQGIKASMYCSQWFLTMFSYRFPMDIVFRIYDNCLASGIEAMFAFSMALLSKNETTLLSMKFDQLLGFLNQRIFEVYQVGPVDPSQPQAEIRYRVDEFIQDAFALRITPFMLDNYAHEYEELIRARDAHKTEMESLKNQNQRLSAQVRKLEDSLAQLNTEHCQVLNELVMSRLRHEELEGELVRYKLLYAEAMHQSEDALSSHRISLVSKRGSSSTNG